MGILDTVRAALRGDAGGGLTTFVDQRGLFEDYVLGLSAEDMYRTQPHLRTVISFLARNVAQLGIHCFARVSDTDRKRVKDDPVAELLASPNDNMTTYDLVTRLVSDLALYDEALWVFEEDMSRDPGWRLEAIPPSWIQRFGGGSVFGAEWVEIQPPGTARPQRIPRSNYVHFHGWDPSSLNKGTTPVAALKATLQEQIHAVRYRDQIWTRAGRVGITVTRPTPDKGGAKWTPEQKAKFKRILDAKLSGDSGSEAGGSIILEDGMTMNRVGFSAHEDDFIEGAKLALSTVAQVYHVNPTMIGLLDNANFSNVREFNRSLYTNTLGPILAQLSATINTFLVPRISTEDSLYVEFNIAEKLQGSFEEQAAVVSTATGRPWQTVNEARARFNMPAVEGGDELSIPLNVVLGGGPQASAQDSAPPKSLTLEDLGELARMLKAPEQLEVKGGDPKDVRVFASKARAQSSYEKNAARLLKAFYARQRKAVLSAMGAKSAEWWDEDRWNRELSDDLFKLAALTATTIGRVTAEAMGFDADNYDEARTLKFLRAVADSRAQKINGATLTALEEALDSEEDEEGNPTRTPADVFDDAENVRADSGATALVTTFSAFATVEAAKQLSNGKATKTWMVNSANPRPAHAQMDGETVPVEELFSNGANWPGDPVLEADGVSNCECSVEITLS